MKATTAGGLKLKSWVKYCYPNTFYKNQQAKIFFKKKYAVFEEINNKTPLQPCCKITITKFQKNSK